MKQQQLTFEKGMTNVPSDALCSDNALEESVGMVYRDGEHHVVQKPEDTLISSGMDLVFVHHVSDGSDVHIYNGPKADNYRLFAESADAEIPASGHASSVVVKVSAIGNTLIVLFDDAVHYFLWSHGTSYSSLDLPVPDFSLTMKVYGSAYQVTNTARLDASWFDDDYVKVEHQDDLNNVILGLYSKNKKAHAKECRFVNPFMARVALELYDGSYTRISQPVMLFPCVTMNSYAGLFGHSALYLHTRGYTLWYTLDHRLTQYSDIVKGIAIFVSKEVDVYDTDVDQPWGDYLEEGDKIYDHILEGVYEEEYIGGSSNSKRVLMPRDVDDIRRSLVTQSVFYKISTVSLEQTEMHGAINTYPVSIEDGTLEHLETCERLNYDDYYSYCTLYGDYLFTYNSRLHLSGLRRNFFKGFDYFMTYYGRNTAPAPTYTFYVTIKTGTGDIVVSHSEETLNEQGIYFYYPDPRATHVVIMKGDDCVCSENLKEHPGLNGAYYFKGLPGAVSHEETVQDVSAPIPTVNPMEPLPSTLAVSEANNPFVFLSSGYVKVGSGDIIGMSSQTQALSQGQFGEYPLIVFTTDGIWALSMNDVGAYVSSRPFSREVALLSNPAITPVDGAVFFVSKKGLMVVEGSRVSCVSAQLSGKGVYNTKYFETCFIAYDYRDSLLWIFDGGTHDGVTGSKECLIYSMKTGTFGLFDFGVHEEEGSGGEAVVHPTIVQRVVNDYPDYLLQDTRHLVFSLMNRVNINDDGERYSASLRSRPMKLEDGLSLKRIIQVLHVMDMDLTYDTSETAEDPETHEETSVTVTHNTLAFSMNGSNDARTWCPLDSLRGTPWKYYRFEYSFSNLKASDTFAGTVLTTEEVRNEKLRK